MNHFSYLDSNIRRLQNLLDTSVNAAERQILQRLLSEEEKAKASLPESEPKDRPIFL